MLLKPKQKALMKTKSIISKLVVAVLFSPLAHSAFAVSDKGNINFSGEIQATACKLDGGYSYNKTVDMKKVSPDQVKNGYAGTPVMLHFTECDLANGTLSLRFTDLNKENLVAVDESIRGVAIGLFKPNGGSITSLSQLDPVEIKDGNATVNFTAKYVPATSGATITAGPATGNAAIEVTYQ